MNGEDLKLSKENSRRIQNAIFEKFNELFPFCGSLGMCKREADGLHFVLDRAFERVFSVFIKDGALISIDWNGTLIHAAKVYDDGVALTINNTGVIIECTLNNGTHSYMFFQKEEK